MPLSVYLIVARVKVLETLNFPETQGQERERERERENKFVVTRHNHWSKISLFAPRWSRLKGATCMCMHAQAHIKRILHRKDIVATCARLY